MSDLHYENNKASILDTAQYAPVADTVTPEAGKISGESLAAKPRVL